MRSGRYLLLSIILFLQFSVQAQNFQADFSEKYNSFSGVINSVPVADGWLMIRKSFDKSKLYQDVSLFKLLLVNNKMDIIKEVELPITNNKFMEVEGLFKANGQIVIVYAYKLARADKAYFIAAKKINEKDLSAGPEIGLGSYQSRYGNDTPSFKFEYATDSSKYFLFNEPIQKGKENKQFYFRVLSNDLTVLQQRTIELDAQSRLVSIQNSCMDKDANVYVEYRVYEKEVESELFLDEDGKIPDYKTTITRYGKDGKEKAVTPDLSGNFLHTARLLSDKNGNLQIAGTYKPEVRGRLKGIFFCSYDAATNQTSKVTMTEIPADIIERFDNDGQAKTGGKNPGISANFNPRFFTERANGSFDFNLEYNSAIQHRPADPNGHFEVRLVSGGILSINISKGGAMKFSRIPKKQKSDFSTANLSHYSFAIGNKTIFLYNDDKDNADRDIDKKPDEIENFRQSVLMAAIVDEKGNISRQIVYEHNDDKFVTKPRAFRRVTNNSFFTIKTKTGAVLAFENTSFGILTVTKL